MNIVKTPESRAEVTHTFLYCLIEKIVLTIHFVKIKNNGKYLVEEFEAIPYAPSSTPYGKIILLFKVTYFKVIETSAPLVVLMSA
jgi:hypothetical protein